MIKAKSIMKKKGISQGYLANILGVSPSYVSKVFRSRIKPSPTFKRNLSLFLTTPEEELFEEIYTLTWKEWWGFLWMKISGK